MITLNPLTYGNTYDAPFESEFHHSPDSSVFDPTPESLSFDGYVVPVSFAHQPSMTMSHASLSESDSTLLHAALRAPVDLMPQISLAKQMPTQMQQGQSLHLQQDFDFSVKQEDSMSLSMSESESESESECESLSMSPRSPRSDSSRTPSHEEAQQLATEQTFVVKSESKQTKKTTSTANNKAKAKSNKPKPKAHVVEKKQSKSSLRPAQKRGVPESRDFASHTHTAFSGILNVAVQDSNAAGVWKRHSCSYTINVKAVFPGQTTPVMLSSTVRLYQHSAFEKLGKGERRQSICRPLCDKRAIISFDDCDKKKNVAHPKLNDDAKYDAIHQLEWRGPVKGKTKGPTQTSIAFTIFSDVPVVSASLASIKIAKLKDIEGQDVEPFNLHVHDTQGNTIWRSDSL
jgi:hypothetical protein